MLWIVDMSSPQSHLTIIIVMNCYVMRSSMRFLRSPSKKFYDKAYCDKPIFVYLSFIYPKI